MTEKILQDRDNNLPLSDVGSVLIDESRPRQESRSFFVQDFFQNPLIHWISLGSLFLNIAVWAALAYFTRSRPDFFILHYNVYFGVDIVGSWQEVFYLPGIGLLFFLINFCLARHFYVRKERIISYLLLLGAFIVQLSLAIASVGVIRINY